MKKTVAFLLAALMMFSFCACGNPYKGITQEQIDEKLKSDEFGTLICFYSVKNTTTSSNSFWVQFDVAFQDSSFYSADGTLVKFFGDKVFYDENGNVIDESELTYGDTMRIIYDCKTYGDNPVTIKAIRVEKLSLS